MYFYIQTRKKYFAKKSDEKKVFRAGGAVEGSAFTGCSSSASVGKLFLKLNQSEKSVLKPLHVDTFGFVKLFNTCGNFVAFDTCITFGQR